MLICPCQAGQGVVQCIIKLPVFFQNIDCCTLQLPTFVHGNSLRADTSMEITKKRFLHNLHTVATV